MEELLKKLKNQQRIDKQWSDLYKLAESQKLSKEEARIRALRYAKAVINLFNFRSVDTFNEIMVDINRGTDASDVISKLESNLDLYGYFNREVFDALNLAEDLLLWIQKDYCD